MKRALVIPAEGMPTSVMVEDTYNFIRNTVGGWFDCVRQKSFHGYVHDTGLIDGLPFNPIASIVFGQVICGDVCLFGSFNAQGEYDGDEHHIDPAVIEAVKRQWFLFKTNSDAGVKI
jgi:hypothetical protein